MLPAGTYLAKLVSIEESDKPGLYGDYLTWTFNAQHESKEAKLTARTGVEFRKGVKARKWADALGGPFEKGQPIDLEFLEGSDCRIRVEVVAGDDDPDDLYNRVVAVGRAPQAPQAPQADIVQGPFKADTTEELPF